MNPVWRLVEDQEASGPWNMGVDEALLASAKRGRPTLRLYRWRGPWLSIGYGQPVEPDLVSTCQTAGVGIVRRVTGGRAVLHGADLTYGIASPDELLPATLQGTYDWVARVLLTALDGFGLDATRSGPDAAVPGRDVFDCFASAAPEEICVGGRKLAGSAQRRVQGAVLQHGSIRLTRDPDAAVAATGLTGSGATSLAELVGADSGSAGVGTLRRVLVDAFESALDQELSREGLSRGEEQAARQREASHPSDLLWAPSVAGRPADSVSRALTA